MNERTARLAGRLGAGAALVAVPLAGMHLYLKHQAGAAPVARAVEDSTDEALAKLRNVDAKLIGYREVAKFAAGVSGPRAIATDTGGRIYVLGANAVRVTAEGTRSDFPLTAGEHCLAVRDGTIYAGFKDHVELFDSTGQRKSVWPNLPAGSLITGIAVGESDAYLADSGRRVVVRTDRAGKVLNEIGRTDAGRAVPGILLPSPHLNVAIADDGTVWVNNTGMHRMENYSADGTLERFWGLYGMNVEGFIGCCNPSDFALLSDGSFVTSEKGVTRVKHYLADGRFDSFVAAPAAFAPDIGGVKLAAGPEEKVFVLDRADGVVHVFAPAAGGNK